MVLVQCAEYTFTIIFFYMIILVNLSVYLTLCEGQVIFPPRALCRNASVPGCIMQDDFTWRGPDRGIAGPACTTTCLRCGAGGRGGRGQRRHGRGREGIGWPGEGKGIRVEERVGERVREEGRGGEGLHCCHMVALAHLAWKVDEVSCID